ncbi:hypothetical protein BWI92_19605 [Flectobacillus sp. BAB-3569]|nr:hypothetical protein BWI92_19605 [Flectobacillus sp. BAB-3569]
MGLFYWKNPKKYQNVQRIIFGILIDLPNMFKNELVCWFFMQKGIILVYKKIDFGLFFEK